MASLYSYYPTGPPEIAIPRGIFTLRYQPERLCEGELGADPFKCFRATSAASSFALFTYCPSYQYRAEMFWPWTVTVLDHAVRPPDSSISLLSTPGSSERRMTYHVDLIQFGI